MLKLNYYLPILRVVIELIPKNRLLKLSVETSVEIGRLHLERERIDKRIERLEDKRREYKRRLEKKREVNDE